MSDAPTDDNSRLTDAPTSAPPSGNRLSIAHLLLWTTMTAVAFAFLQGHSPKSEPPAPSGDAQFDEAMLQLRDVERWAFYSLLAFAPAYALTMAAVVLAGWRLATGRLGFPVQPGHWLLLLLATVPGAAFAISLFDPLSSIVVVVGTMFYVSIVAVLAVLKVSRPVRWLWAYKLLATGMAILWIQSGLGVIFDGTTQGGMVLLFLLSTIALVSALLTALACSALDLTAREGYDVFHWTGVAVLIATLAHVFVLWSIDVGLRV